MVPSLSVPEAKPTINPEGPTISVQSPGRPQLQAAAAGLVRGPDHAALPDAAPGRGGAGGGGAREVPGGGRGLGEVPWDFAALPRFGAVLCGISWNFYVLFSQMLMFFFGCNGI